MISRQQILEAAFNVFAEYGFRGATTRRIADAAGVNEVTLFRRFKSKTALINEAAHLYAQRRVAGALPAVPVDPVRELTDWCAAQLDHLERSRAYIRKCMAELEEHPEMADCMRHGPVATQTQLRDYARALGAHYGIDIPGDQVLDACTCLHGSLFADAMGREMMPQIYPRPRASAPTRYARIFLQAVGVPQQVLAASPTRGVKRPAANGRSANGKQGANGKHFKHGKHGKHGKPLTARATTTRARTNGHRPRGRDVR